MDVQCHFGFSFFVACFVNLLFFTLALLAFLIVAFTCCLVIFIVLEWVLVGIKIVLMAALDDVPEDVEMQIERQDFIISKIINLERDEEKDLEDDELFEIEEPLVHASDPGLQDPNKKKDDEEGGDGDKGDGE